MFYFNNAYGFCTLLRALRQWSPSYNRIGWLGVKHQDTYLLDSESLIHVDFIPLFVIYVTSQKIHLFIVVLVCARLEVSCDCVCVCVCVCVRARARVCVVNLLLIYYFDCIDFDCIDPGTQDVIGILLR